MVVAKIEDGNVITPKAESEISLTTAKTRGWKNISDFEKDRDVGDKNVDLRLVCIIQ